MANKVLWYPEAAATLMTTELDNLVKSAVYPPANYAIDAADYVNATNKFRFAAFQLVAYDFDAAPAAGGIFELHLIYQFDGTVYADGLAGNLAALVLGGNTFVGAFGPVTAAAVPHTMQLCGVKLLPFDFRACIVNRTSQDLADSSTHTLKIFPYDEEIQ